MPLAFDRTRLARVADALVVAVAISLPWSTSATGILVVVWLIAVIPTLEWADVRRELMTAIGGLPILLVLLGLAGVIWSDASWPARWNGLVGFAKLLVIPLLMAQFRRSDRGYRVFLGFLIACVALLVASYLVTIWPDLPRTSRSTGVPVKSYILQSVEFTVCAAVLFDLAIAQGRMRRWASSLALALLASAFLGNIFFIVTARTALVIIAALLLLYGYRQSGWKGALAAVLIGLVVTAFVWSASSYLRQRVSGVYTETAHYEQKNAVTSTGERLDFWKKSLRFMSRAPLIGRGTGSIAEQFDRAAEGQTGAHGITTTNPHNLTFAVGIQLGLLGIVVLWAMWIAQFIIFYRGAGLLAWIALVVVTQNIVGSLFNSFIFDFTEGWLYVVGLGVVAGMLERQSDGARVPKAEAAAPSPS